MKNLAIMVLNIILICAITVIGCILFDRYKEKNKSESVSLTKEDKKEPVSQKKSVQNSTNQNHLVYLQNKSIDLEKQKNYLVQENQQLKNKVSVLSKTQKREVLVDNPNLVNKVSLLEKENKSLRDSLNRERQIVSYKEKVHSLSEESCVKKEQDHKQVIDRLMAENDELKSRKCVAGKETPTPKKTVTIVKPTPKPSPTPMNKKVILKPLPEVKQYNNRVDELN